MMNLNGKRKKSRFSRIYNEKPLLNVNVFCIMVKGYYEKRNIAPNRRLTFYGGHYVEVYICILPRDGEIVPSIFRFPFNYPY